MRDWETSSRMIRLIAADMDGTLLNSRGELPEHLFDAIRMLRERGVLFAVASGRQYYNLENLFAPVRDEMIFLYENGSMIFSGGKLAYADGMKRSDLDKIIGAVRSLPRARIVLCGVRGAYTDCTDEQDLPFIRQYFDRLDVTENLERAFKQDTICKISVLERGHAEQSCYPVLARFSNLLQVCLSGENWVDVMNSGINKGNAIKQVQQKYGIAPGQCMSFGDYLNDVQMQCRCYHSYAMANAHPQLKRVSRYVCPSNDENGVLRTIQEVFSLNLSE